MNAKTEAKHTQGPWRIDVSEATGRFWNYKITALGKILCTVWRHYSEDEEKLKVGHGTDKANAFLIAAAPIILTAHHDIRKAISEFTGGNLEFFLATLDKISSAAIQAAKPQ